MTLVRQKNIDGSSASRYTPPPPLPQAMESLGRSLDSTTVSVTTQQIILPLQTTPPYTVSSLRWTKKKEENQLLVEPE
jgi:hypothetical protein